MGGTSLFVALELRPLVDAEQLPRGHAVLVAERQPLHRPAGRVPALGERVQAQQSLQMPQNNKKTNKL